jgi:hypothetical protein
LPPSFYAAGRSGTVVVILRESGVSSTPRLCGSITDDPGYWITRWSLSSGGHSADPLAGDDGFR